MAKKKPSKRAQKRRDRRRATITLPGGETARQRPGQGARTDIERDPQRTVREARMRHGLSEDQASSDMAGCAVGRRLMIDRIEDRAALWQAVKHMRRVTLAYDRAIGAPKRHAKCLGILAPLDALHADASSPAPDFRSDEDKQRQAVAAWMRLKCWLAHTDGPARIACTRHVLDEPDEPIADWTGVVLALRCVSEGVKGQRVKVRARIRRTA